MKPSRRTAGRLEDFDLICHETPERVCERLGVKPEALGRYLLRHGRAEQGRAFLALHRRLWRAEHGRPDRAPRPDVP